MLKELCEEEKQLIGLRELKEYKLLKNGIMKFKGCQDKLMFEQALSAMEFLFGEEIKLDIFRVNRYISFIDIISHFAYWGA